MALSPQPRAGASAAPLSEQLVSLLGLDERQKQCHADSSTYNGSGKPRGTKSVLLC